MKFIKYLFLIFLRNARPRRKDPVVQTVAALNVQPVLVNRERLLCTFCKGFRRLRAHPQIKVINMITTKTHPVLAATGIRRKKPVVLASAVNTSAFDEVHRPAGFRILLREQDGRKPIPLQHPQPGQKEIVSPSFFFPIIESREHGRCCAAARPDRTLCSSCRFLGLSCPNCSRRCWCQAARWPIGPDR